MIEKFCDIDSQMEVRVKMRYQLFDESNSQIYYSDNLEELMKVYNKLSSPKSIYEVVERYDNVVKLSVVASQEGEKK